MRKLWSHIHHCRECTCTCIASFPLPIPRNAVTDLTLTSKGLLHLASLPRKTNSGE